MKKIISLLLAILLILSFSACAIFVTEDEKEEIKTPDSSESLTNSVSTDIKEENPTEENEELPEEEVKKPTLADAELRLISFFTDKSHENPYLLLAYYGPQENFELYFCDKDGNYSNIENIYYYNLNNGWRLLQTEDFPEGTTLDDIAVNVIDHSVEGEPSKILTVTGEAMTKDELKNIGLTYIGDNFVTFSHNNKATYSDSYAVFSVGIVWYNRLSFLSRNVPFDIKSFEFFTKEGKPLSEFADGYDYSVDVGTNSNNIVKGVSVMFYVNDGNRDKERNKDFCDYLHELGIYMTYKAEDGTIVKVENVLEAPEK